MDNHDTWPQHTHGHHVPWTIPFFTLDLLTGELIDGTARVRLEVFQSSGGDLDLSNNNMCVFYPLQLAQS
jgi:hypothetical protein